MVSKGWTRQRAGDLEAVLRLGRGGARDFTTRPRTRGLGLAARHLVGPGIMQAHMSGYSARTSGGAPTANVRGWRPGRSGSSCTVTSPRGCRPLSCRRGGRLADALFAATRQRVVPLHVNKGLAGAPADAVGGGQGDRDQSRGADAFALAIIGGAGPSGVCRPPDLAAARRDARAIGLAMAELRKWRPDAGSYVSESDYFERDWQRASLGRELSAAAGGKAAYDPDGLFFVHHGVGSEDWSADGLRALVGGERRDGGGERRHRWPPQCRRERFRSIVSNDAVRLYVCKPQ